MLSPSVLEDLYNSRIERLHRLLHLNAPKEIIKEECKLVLRSLTGGTRLSTLKYLTLELIYHVWDRWIVMEVQVLLCKLKIYHVYEEVLIDYDNDNDDTELKCVFCRKVKPV